jgi:hypothetical protein
LGGFKREIVAGFEFINAALIDVESDNWALTAKFNGERKTDIAQTDD